MELAKAGGSGLLTLWMLAMAALHSTPKSLSLPVLSQPFCNEGRIAQLSLRGLVVALHSLPLCSYLHFQLRNPGKRTVISPPNSLCGLRLISAGFCYHIGGKTSLWVFVCLFVCLPFIT